MNNNKMPDGNRNNGNSDVPRRTHSHEKLPRGAVPSRKTDKPKSAGRTKYKRRKELDGRVVAVLFALTALIITVLCVYGAYSYVGDSIRLISQDYVAAQSSSRTYTIVYSESDTWGYGAAVSLRDLFAEKTGATLRIVPDSEPVGMHELRVGYTNRANDDYLTSVGTLGTDGYAIIISSGNSVSLNAFSETGATAAIQYFLSSYVGSYRPGKLTFANKMNFSYVSRSGEEPDMSLCQSKITLNCNSIGKFKVLVISDADINPYTTEAIGAIVQSEKPGLVIFNGDISPGLTTKAELEDYLNKLVKPIEDAKIPWTVVFGEQDTSGGLSAEQQIEVCSSFENCVAKSNYVSDGTVSCFIPVYADGDDGVASTPVFGIYTLGQTSLLSLVGNGASSEPLFSSSEQDGSDYGYVPSKHIAWFTDSAQVLAREGGGNMPSIVVCHTPIEEFNVIPVNPESTMMVGTSGEPVSSSPVHSGLFAAALDARSVYGIYCGHDHLNAFSGKYCGIELAYVASIGYDGYGFGGTFDTNNSLRGGRIIEFSVKESGTSVTSRMAYASDYGISRD